MKVFECRADTWPNLKINDNFTNLIKEDFNLELKYTGLFLPPVIFSLLHLQTFSLRFEFAQTKPSLKRDNIRVIRPV